MLFDWGGTITPFHNVDMIDGWRMAAQVLAPDRQSEVAEALLAAERDIWLRTTSTLRSATTAEVLRNASAATGLPVDQVLHDDAIAAYLDHWAPASYPRHDAHSVLTELRRQGMRLGLLSNTHWPRAWHEQVLARDGLLDLFEARIYTSDLEHVKPHAEAFNTLLRAMNVDAQRAIFVGDRQHDDIGGAAAVGMRTVWIRNDFVPRADVVPDAAITELTELLDLLRRWQEGE